MARFPFHVATIVAVLLSTATIRADDEPWKADPLTLEALQAAERDLTQEIKPLAEDASTDEKAWDEARRERLSLLHAFVQLIKAVDETPAIDDPDAQVKGWADKTVALRESKPPALPEIQTKKDLQPLEEAQRDAAAAVSKVDKRIQYLKELAAEGDKRMQTLPTRRAELQEEVNKLGSPKSGSVSAYRLGNAQLELRMLKELESVATDLRARVSDERKVRVAELDYRKLEQRRASEALSAGSEALEAASAAEAKRLEAEGERAKEEARRAKDPVERFRAAMQVEITALNTALKSDVTTQTQLDRRALTENALLEQYRKRYERLSKRELRAEAMSAATAKELHDELQSFDRREQSIRRVALPKVLRDLSDVEREIISIQDREWDLELAPSDTAIWKEWVEPLPDTRTAEGKAVFDEMVVGTDGLRAKLRARVSSLNKSHRSLTLIENTYRAQLTSLVDVETFIRSRIYWVRTDPPLGRDLFANVNQEFANLVDFYFEGEFLDELKATVGRQPGLVALGSLLLVVLLVGSTLAARRIKARQMNRPQQGKRLRVGITDALRMLFHAAIPSLVLLGGVELVDRMDMPERIAFPVQTALGGVAFFLFLQRLAWGLLNEDGYLVNHFGVGPDVARQSLRSVRIFTLSAMFFHIPELVLEQAPFDVTSLHRLFGTVFRASQLLAIALLVPRRGAVARAFVGGNPGGLRVIGVVAPVIFILLASIFVMDLLGYRYGATFFTDRAVESFLTILILRAVYAGLNQISGRVVARVRERAYAERDSKTASEDTEKVGTQLSRMITVLTLVIAVVVLGRSWDVGSNLGQILDEMHLVELSQEGSYISVGDLLTALLWILGAHFLAANLGGVFELLIFPIFGEIHRGTRYVVQALSRYIILLIGYSAALVALQFSLQSVGWLLAAASVGLGFGLQEIVGNFVSGLILLVEQPVRVGDVITVGESGGTVEKITIRSTVVNNWDQQQIIIPNKAFITQNVTNWSRNNEFTRRKIPLRVGYGADVEKTLSLLEATVKEQENVRSYPPPRIWFNGFGDYGMEIDVWIYVDIDYGFSTMSAVRRAILEALRGEGIEIAIPAAEIRVTDPRDSSSIDDLQAAAGTLEGAASSPPPEEKK